MFLDRSVCTLIGDCNIIFLDNQINGAVFMMQRSWRAIPLNWEGAEDTSLINTVNYLLSIKTFGGFIVDTIGFGKMFTVLLFLAYQACCAALNILSNQESHRPTLYLVPGGVNLHQWASVIENF